MVHGPMPLTRTSFGRQLVGSEPRPVPEAVGDAGDLAERPGPLALDAERVEPPGRSPGEALGPRRQEQAEVRPRGWLAELVAERRPLPLGLAGGDPLGEDRRQEGVVEVAAGARPDALEAASGGGDDGVQIGHRRRRATGAGHLHRRPAGPLGPWAPGRHGGGACRPSRSRRLPGRQVSSTPGPSTSARAGWSGRPRPWRYHDSVRRRSSGIAGRGRVSGRRTAVGTGRNVPAGHPTVADVGAVQIRSRASPSKRG